MKKILSAILLLTFFFNGLAYAQQNRTPKASNPGYIWSSGPEPKIVTPTATTTYTVGVTDTPSDKEVRQGHNQIKFNQSKVKLQNEDINIEQAVKAVVDMVIYDVEQTENNTTDKMSAVGTLDVIFANKILTMEQEIRLVVNRLLYAAVSSGDSGSWSAISLGVIANYYPKPKLKNPFLPNQEQNDTPLIFSADYNPRDSKYRVLIEDTFKKYILTSGTKLDTRLSMAEGIGFIKDSTSDISKYISELSKTLPTNEYSETENGMVIFSLFRALAYQATVFEIYSARTTLEQYYNGIRGKDEYYNPYPLMTNIYSAFAAGGYGIRSAYTPLKVFALWGDIDHIFETRGIQAVPYSMRKMAYSILPEIERNRVKTEYPDAIETAYEEIDGNMVEVERPVYTGSEYWAISIVNGITGAAELILIIVAWEIASAGALAISFGAEFAIANSLFAEGVGYMIAARGGARGIAAYESFLIMNSAKYAITFAETPLGIMFNKVGKGIKNFFVKFAPQIAVLKRGVVVTSTVLNMNVAMVTAKTLPNVTTKATTEIVLSVAEKEAVNTANTIIRTTTNTATNMAEKEVLSLLQKKGMDVVSSGKYLNAIKPASFSNFSKLPVFQSVNSNLVISTAQVINTGIDKYLIVSDNIPSIEAGTTNMTYTRVFKFQDGQVKSYYGLGNGNEPPVSLNPQQASELDDLINTYNSMCKG